MDHGMGAARGLHPLEHVNWACSVRHPAEDAKVVMDADLEHALEQASEMDVEALD